MPKYLFCGSYTTDGARGLLKEGGTRRRAMLEEMVNSVGGTVECMYFALGDTDLYMIAELPDAVSATALSLTASASGAARAKTVALMSVEDLDLASKKTVTYRPPGG